MAGSEEHIRVVCECGRKLSVRASLAGKRAKCPKCRTVFTVPAQGAEPPAPDPSPTPASPPAETKATSCPQCGAATVMSFWLLGMLRVKIIPAGETVLFL